MTTPDSLSEHEKNRRNERLIGVISVVALFIVSIGTIISSIVNTRSTDNAQAAQTQAAFRRDQQQSAYVNFIQATAEVGKRVALYWPAFSKPTSASEAAAQNALLDMFKAVAVIQLIGSANTKRDCNAMYLNYRTELSDLVEAQAKNSDGSVVTDIESTHNKKSSAGLETFIADAARDLRR